MKTAREVILALWLGGVVISSALAQILDPVVIWANPTSARIKCLSTVPGKMTVEYGTTPSLGQISPPEWRDLPNTDVTRHYVNLIGLQPSTTYYYRVRITPQGGGVELTSDVRSFRTFRRFSKILPTVRYWSYIIGGDWSANDRNAPYHYWNAVHFDGHTGYNGDGFPTLRQLNPDTVLITYDNITNNYAGIWRYNNMHWQTWAEERGISYEHIAMHYAVDTEVALPKPVGDKAFDHKAFVYIVSGTYRAQPIDTSDSYMSQVPAKVGEFIAICHPLRFDAVYFVVNTPASGGWDGVWEYCNAVDANGKPVSWAPLTIVEDTTIVNGQKLARSGFVRFVPPKERTEWKRSRMYSGASDRDEIYHRLTWRRGFTIRFRITQQGTPPTFRTRNDIHHEDFVKPGSGSGREIIPGWDSSWETNPANNGDPEYNPNPPTEGGLGTARSARFKWWSRAWYYKPEILRFLCNVFDPYYNEWFLEAWIRDVVLASQYLDGWYCDNYTPRTTPGTPITPNKQYFIEMGEYSQTAYTNGMAEMMEKIGARLTQHGKLISANNNMFGSFPWSSGFNTADPLYLAAYYAPGIALTEIAMQHNSIFIGNNRFPNPDSWTSFFTERYYRTYVRGQYHIPQYSYTIAVEPANNTAEWWEREKMRALAQYLLIRDPEGELLYLNTWHENFIYGEFLTDPNSSVNRYYIGGIPKQKAYYVDAAERDFGQLITTVPAPYSQFVFLPRTPYPVVIPGLFIIHQTDKAPKYDSQGNFWGNTGRTWCFARRYTRALALVQTGESAVPWDERGINEFTEIQLDGYYYRLRSDNTTDPVPINRINLRKGEGAVLIPTEDAPPPIPSVQVTISADKTNPKPLDVVTVTITATNTGDGEARNVRITHDIPQGATYVRGSLKLNGNTLPDPTDTTRIDVTVASIPAGGQAVVVFQMVIR